MGVGQRGPLAQALSQAAVEVSARGPVISGKGVPRNPIQTHVIIGKIQFLQSCWADGLSSYLAVGQRLPSAPCFDDSP